MFVARPTRATQAPLQARSPPKFILFPLPGAQSPHVFSPLQLAHQKTHSWEEPLISHKLSGSIGCLKVNFVPPNGSGEALLQCPASDARDENLPVQDEQQNQTTNNHEEAQRAKGEGKDEMKRGNYKKAKRLFEISLRLHANPDTTQLLASANAAIARIERPSRVGTAPTAGGAAGAGAGGRATAMLGPIVDRAVAWLSETAVSKFIVSLEQKYVLPSALPYTRGLFACILALATWRFVFKQKLMFGSLPGDFNYRSDNVMVSAPIVSCLLASFLVNAFVRALSNNNR